MPEDANMDNLYEVTIEVRYIDPFDQDALRMPTVLENPSA